LNEQGEKERREREGDNDKVGGRRDKGGDRVIWERI